MGILDRGKISESKEVFDINMASNLSLDLQRSDVESQLKDVQQTRCRNLWWKIAFDVPIVAIVLIVVALYELCVIPSHKGGFYCNDPALSHVFKGDTVTATVLVCTVLGLPFLIVLMTEFLLHTTGLTFTQKFKYSILQTLRVYKYFICGLICNLLVVEAMKGITGNPRPVFFDLCEPDTGKTCNGSEYVSTFTCTSTRFSTFEQYDSYHSFPSGHTSMSVHCGFFVAWYLQRRAYGWSTKSISIVPILQVLSLIYAAICSLTRITDHRHHWWDVLVGSLVGLCSCYYSVSVLLKNFRTRSNDFSSQDSTKILYTSDSRVMTA